MVREFDLRREFGAVGDGRADDMPAFRAMAAAVEVGRVPPGATVRVLAGEYRVVGDASVTLRQPIVIRGDGPGETTIRLEYWTQGSAFLRVVGEGMYVRHTASAFDFGPRTPTPGHNVYPDAPFARVRGVPRRGERAVEVDRPDLFAPGAEVYLLCDDYSDEIAYTPRNRRFRHFLLKQHLGVERVEGRVVHLDTALLHDFAGAEPRLYVWRPVVGFVLEEMTLLDRGTVPDSDDDTTFFGVLLDGVVGGDVRNVHFRDSTSIPLSVRRGRRVRVSGCLFDGARHVGAGGNGYLPQLYLADDCLVERCTCVGGRHALICDWSCWGNVFRYNRIVGTENTELHGEYCVGNLYWRNACPEGRMEIGGGGHEAHGHDGPFNELRENHARRFGVLKQADRDNRLVGNWYRARFRNHGTATVLEGNRRVRRAWTFPYAADCGHDAATAAPA